MNPLVQSLLNLQAGSMVICGGRTYLITEAIEINHLPHFIYQQYQVRGHDDRQRWLTVQPLFTGIQAGVVTDAVVELREEIAYGGPIPTAGTKQLVVEGVTFTLSTWGDSYYRSLPNAPWGIQNFLKYYSSDDATLCFERFDQGPWVVSVGPRVPLDALLVQ